MNRASLSVLLLGLALAACTGPEAPAGNSDRALTKIAGDESIVLFRTAGWFDADKDKWHLPIHGWVFEPEDSVVRKKAMAAALEEKYGLEARGDAEAIFATRVNWLIADNERGKVAFVRIGDTDFEMPPSAENGHFRKTVVLSSAEVDKFAKDGFVHYSIVTREPTSRVFNGVVTLVEPAGMSVISDIDDTIKISEVTEHKALLERALYREFEAAPGMANTYADWASSGMVVHYVSSSPWQLYPALEAFMVRDGFPGASFHLKAIRFRDETLLDLFKEGTETKPAQIEPVLNAWPDRQFVLVGDSGEQDPEIYADLMRRYPDQIRHIFIRNVTGASPDDERFSEVFAGIEADRWQLFTDPAELPR